MGKILTIRGALSEDPSPPKVFSAKVVIGSIIAAGLLLLLLFAVLR